MRWRDDSGQSAAAAIVITFAVVLVAGALATVAVAVSVRNDRQRVADLVAVSAGKVLVDEGPRLFEPPEAGGVPNPRHLSAAALEALVQRRARRTLDANGGGAMKLTLGGGALLPTRVRVTVSAPIEVAGRPIDVRAEAEAETTVSAVTPGAGASLLGAYSGPLATRQGKPMRPDVAAAFDRMQAAATREGIGLIVNSAFRSDAEQAVLFARHPDPRWVAPPGKSLHRLGTELDLGPPAAYPWLKRNAGRYGFVQRYSWEDWHYGYVRSPGSRSVGYGPPDGRKALPAFVPERYAPMLSAAAQRWNVSAALLAAQLFRESRFNPNAVSSAGAAGLAQFMPATGRAYGLSPAERFDPAKAIMAQAHHMHDLLREFGSVPLALAAYNAGPLPVKRCGCVPPYPETTAYVAAILALLAGAGDDAAASAQLQVRLVR
jgi:soluble lytic murein transglycosylase-like protein